MAKKKKKRNIWWWIYTIIVGVGIFVCLFCVLQLIKFVLVMCLVMLAFIALYYTKYDPNPEMVKTIYTVGKIVGLYLIGLVIGGTIWLIDWVLKKEKKDGKMDRIH